jgi:transposase
MRSNDARSLSKSAQAVLRRRALAAIDNGMTRIAAAKVFGVSYSVIGKWQRRRRAGGRAALATDRRGRPTGQTRLSAWQAAVIVNLITDRTPDQLKLPFVLWTREAVRDLIRERFGLSLSVWTVGRHLRRWGFTAQKPVRRAWERDDAAVRRWLKVEYPSIRRQAKVASAEIHWGDEMGLRSDHQAGRSYSPRGQTPVIAGTGKRFGCNVISTVTNRGTLRFMVFKTRFTTEVFIEFLSRLVRSVSGKIFLIVDGHPVHKSAAVRRWLNREENRGKIRLYILPSYSPDLNPDEFLNHDVKQNAVGRRRARDQRDLIADVRCYLRSTQKRPDIVCNYFQAPSVRYAAT